MEDDLELEAVSVDELHPEDLDAAHDILWELAEDMRSTDPWEAWLLRSIARNLVERAPTAKSVSSERWSH